MRVVFWAVDSSHSNQWIALFLRSLKQLLGPHIGSEFVLNFLLIHELIFSSAYPPPKVISLFLKSNNRYSYMPQFIFLCHYFLVAGSFSICRFKALISGKFS